jgi:hypothetical protein
MSRTPTFIEAMLRLKESAIKDIRIATPARVTRYDASLQQIDAQPLIKEAHQNEQGERVAEALPVICNVPVVFPGAGPFRVTFPISEGDEVLLIFSASSLDVWLSEGGLVDPLDDRRFALTDAFALPGVRSFKTPLASAPTDRLTIGHDEGAQINIDETSIRLGSTVGQLVALSNKVESQLAELRDKFNAHTHGLAPVLPAEVLNPLTFPASTAASDVYAKE